jgi:AraC family cel operon transcriptional repressor
MKSSKFDLSYFLNQNEKFHIARVNITSIHDLSYHSHAYSEIFWIEKGAGFHNINGSRFKIEAGDLVMMRPDDEHAFSPIGKGLTLVNVAFETNVLAYFRNRYFPNTTFYFWSDKAFPFQMKLSKKTINRISARAEETISYSRSYLQLDSLLLFIFRQVTANEKVDNHSDVPLWLFNAIQQYNSPEYFRQGIGGFVTLCERNESYINRTVRMHFGKTLTEILNESKLQYATTQLSLTGMPIKEVCDNCGFHNLGHFYKIFKERYNQTPMEYRKINQKII